METISMKILQRCDFFCDQVICNFCCSIMEINQDDILKIQRHKEWADTNWVWKYHTPKYECGVCGEENTITNVDEALILKIYKYQLRLLGEKFIDQID